ncbi:polymerase [Brevundimonas sp. LM2]|uniref:O-antigen ligase family protein n=1 Tax=Brevundimonas sp. LM2 TaxID=1938605 RepID=UPI0009840750|nr:O-antigen ligase family protein [Brevundimonas sp. LM2]AQR61787.1 polymerase [Brevundimonas sp. LM2]
MRASSALIEPADPAPPLWEQAAAMFVVIMLTQALVGPVFAPTQEETPILRLVWLPVYAVIAVLIALRPGAMVRAWPAWLILGLLVLHAFASRWWSIDPGVTERRVIAMALSSAFAIYLGAVFSGRHLPRLLMLAALFMGLGSLIMILVNPTIGIHQADNAGLWRGLWYEKNQMGLVMSAGAVAAAACLASGDPRRRLPVLTLAVTTLLVLATQSKTSLLCLIVGVGAIAALWAMRRGGAAFAIIAVWLGVVLTAAAGYVFITDPAAVLTALGKDPSLTGRTDIWAALMREVAERPWTGFGYAAFWERGSVPAAFIRAETQWPVPSAHNGWIDLLIQLGWPGAILVGLTVALAALATLFRIPGTGAREGYWGVGYLAVFLLLSLSESVLLSHANLPWTLLLAILARGVSASSLPSRVPSLAWTARGAYQTAPRIGPHSSHARLRQPVPVR